MSGSGDYISREAAIEAFYTATADGDKADWCVGVIQSIPAADAIEELSAYVRQIDELRKDDWYLQKTKMMTYGQATMTMPLPEPPEEET